MSIQDTRERFHEHDGREWFVIDTDTDGVHKFGRAVGGPMDDDSAERVAHELNDHRDDHRYLASQKLDP
jgi:hypothetical protein